MKKSYYAIIPANVRYCKGLPPNAKLLYGEITALCNEKGYCWATNRYFAELYEVSNTSISIWISKLKDQGFISVEMEYKKGSKEILNRYIKILNDPIKENLNTPIKENLKDNTTVINNTLNNKTVVSINRKKHDLLQQPKSVSYSNQFEDFWKLYPKKTGKKFAYTCYQKARMSNDILLPAVKEQIRSKQWQRGYVPNPSTWLNQGRWDDEVMEEKSEVRIEMEETMEWMPPGEV
jgi:hypothetical protein